MPTVSFITIELFLKMQFTIGRYVLAFIVAMPA